MSERLKMNELAQRAGVSKSTIQHYAREDLLPPPVEKPHKNMAYYSQEHIDRLKLIKELRAKGSLSLDEIQELLDDPQELAEIRAFLFNEPFAAPEKEPESIRRSQILQQTDLEAGQLDTLEELGIVDPQTSNGDKVYDAVDAAIIHSIVSLKQAGLNRSNGFSIEDLTLYRDTIESLVQSEYELFLEKMDDKVDPEALSDIITEGLEGINMLIMALRRKYSLEKLDEEYPDT